MRLRFLILSAAAAGLVLGQKTPPTAQAIRGKELFLKSAKGTACGTCHAMDGAGTAVGPDLTKLAGLAMPRGMVMAIRMSMTETVQEIKPVTGDAFPGRVELKEGDVLKVWDLSQKPPVLRTFAAKDVDKIKRDEKWKHPPTSVDYEAQELADIIGFLRWASTGSQKEVKAEEVE